MNPTHFTVDELIRRAGELPPLPQVAQKALGLIRDPNSNMSDLANVLSMDQVLTGLVLRWANSAYYGLSHPVSTVQQAVMYLGQTTVQSLVLTASVAAYMDRPVPGYGLDRGDLWKHSVGVAAGARLVASRHGRKVAEEAYHTGLLCDIGKLAFESILRNVDTTSKEWSDKPFSDLEQTYFGIDHAALGAEMARRWKLPPNVQEAIGLHHTPALAKDGIVLAASVHIADALMMMLGIGIGRDGLQYTLDPQALAIVGWDDNNLEPLLEQTSVLVKEAENYIGLIRK
jgi:putative nucleotidyltransferase with HDIG domain